MNRRIIAGILTVMMLIAFLSSVIFVSAEVCHECEGEHCHICQCIDMCLSILKVTGMVSVIVFAKKVFEKKTENITFEGPMFCHATLTDLKIQMNN